MENLRKVGIFPLLTLMLMFNSCMKDVDLSGFFYSSEPVNERVVQSLRWNENHDTRNISVSDKDYSLLIAGDTQVGGAANLDTLFIRAKGQANTGFVIVGDLTNGQKKDYDILKKELDEKNIVPAFLILGNHDLFFHGWNTYYEYFGSSTYTFTVTTNDNTDLYICLDSGNGTIGSRQLEWLQNLLETERKNNRFCIIFSHVNFFREHHTFSGNPMVDELHALLDLFYSHSVDMVIMGHDHQRSEELLGKTRYITLDAFYDGFKQASYLKLEIKNNKLLYTFNEL
jgi:UDP-2,3-diacylglucosamine pyrophosphatase LpxH